MESTHPHDDANEPAGPGTPHGAHAAGANGDWGDDVAPPPTPGVEFAHGEPAPEDWHAHVHQAAAEAARAADRAASAGAEAASDVAERVAERLEGLAEDIHRRIAAVLHALPDRLAGAGLQPDEIDHIRAGIEQAGERAAARIEHKVAHVVARARVLAERGERRARRERGEPGERRRWGAGFGPVPVGPFGPRGPFGPKGPVGPRATRDAGEAQSGETLTVLRMLGEGKITADEAERLLAAMGRVSQTA